MLQADHRGGPLESTLGRAAGRLIGRLAEPLYRAAITRINRQYDARAVAGRVARLPIPVVSVGNLSVGGTGKTPMVERLVRELLSRGRSPCIAMRGYAKSSTTKHHAPASPRSDEEDVYHRLLPGVPIVAQPDRAAGVRSLLAAPDNSRPPIDTVVLDDGFQHRRLARDFDLVLIDASRDPFADRLLPAGWLREPVESLRRAHAVVLTHAELVSESDLQRLTTRVAELIPSRPLAACRHQWQSLSIGENTQDLNWLRGKRIIATCAIGNPAGFLAAAKHAGANIIASLIRPDHDPYAPRTVQLLTHLIRTTEAEAVITTEKDWSKLRLIPNEWTLGLPIARPALGLHFDQGWNDIIAAMLA